MSENNEMELIGTALQSFDRVSAGLALLEKNYKGILYDVEDAMGMDHAKAARAAIREPRYEIERVRKSAKAPLLALGKRLDSEAARITTALLTLETPIDDQIKVEEERKEAEKRAKIEAEAKRQKDIQDRIDGMRTFVTNAANLGSANILHLIAALDEVAIDDSFAEFQIQAKDAKDATLSRLRELHASAVKREAEAEQQRLDRIELDRLRSEQAERDAAAAAERARLDAIAKTERDAEAARHAEELRRQREQFAAQQAEADRLAREARERQEAEDRRLREQREAFEREQEALRKAQEPAPVVAAAKPLPAILRGERPSSGQILRVVADHFGVSTETANEWITEAWG